VVTRKDKVVSFDESGHLHPSVVTYEGESIVCGKRALAGLDSREIGILGNTVRGPKKLISQEIVNIEGRSMSPVQVIGDYIKYLVQHAKDKDVDGIADLNRAVVTIPVALDGRGRKTLRTALLEAGVYVEAFVHEPLAALYGHFRGQDDFQQALSAVDGKFVLVFDWGGGTLDLTLCKVTNGVLVQVLSRGNNMVGGDYMDEAIMSHVVREHEMQHGWNNDNKLPVNPGMRAKLLAQCEQAKIILSSREKHNIFLPNYFQGEGEPAEIDISLDRSTLQTICLNMVEQGVSEIQKLLSSEHADIDVRTIAMCLATGGMVNMPMIKLKLNDIFGVTALEISSKGDRVISEGAAWIARDDAVLTLAKPFELAEARHALLTVVHEGTVLPERGCSIQRQQSMYCSDPRDAKAIFSFKRPQMVGKCAAADPRTSYGSLVVDINPDFPPLEERIELRVTIDDNFIVTASGVGDSEKVSRKIEFYDLEFSLDALSSVRTVGGSWNDEVEKAELKSTRTILKPSRENAVQYFVRANVTQNKNGWEAVPGELLKSYNDDHVFMKKRLTQQQEIENVRYQPCSNCGAKWAKQCCGGVVQEPGASRLKQDSSHDLV